MPQMTWDFKGMTSSGMSANTEILATLHLDPKLPSFNAHFYDLLLVQLQEWTKFVAVRRWRFLVVCLFVYSFFFFFTFTWCKGRCLWTTLGKICKILTKKTDLWNFDKGCCKSKEELPMQIDSAKRLLKNGRFFVINLTLLGNESTCFECKYQGQI